jgi:hypothetical protein
MVLISEINIIATSSAELFSGVIWRALACSSVHWRALACTGVLWCEFACSGMLWRALACSGVFWGALACSGMLWHSLECSGVLWHALVCRTQVLDNRNPLPDNRTQITWIIYKNSSAVMCVFLKLFVHDFFDKFIDSIDLKWCIGHWFTHPVIKKWF